MNLQKLIMWKGGFSAGVFKYH